MCICRQDLRFGPERTTVLGRGSVWVTGFGQWRLMLFFFYFFFPIPYFLSLIIPASTPLGKPINTAVT